MDKLKELLNSEYNYVRLWTATYLLSIDEQKAKVVLQQLAGMSNFLGLTADTTLKEWEKGNLKI